METRHFQTGPTGFADRTVSRPVVRISANAAIRIDATLSLSLSFSFCLATARFDCQVTIYSPAIPFNRDAILLGDGIERKGARIHRREVRGRSAWRTKKKEWGRTERRRGEYTYIYTHTKHCSILIKARDLAIANRDETSPLSICRYV